jgi:hypothetical protein|tara:strand:+ start:201 stop:770 length:570 start_codon:yes stop_codon:yes gene_type:complete
VYLDLLRDSSFYQFLLQIDQDLAEQAQRSGCRFCGAPLHSACYGRRPRGVPQGIDPGPGFSVCYSFCCSAEGCRRRHRAPSVRFLKRRVYLAVMVALATAMRQGPSPRTARELGTRFGADRRTLCRWRRWWQSRFPRSDFWRREAAHFMPGVDETQLPRSLIAAFIAPMLIQKVLSLLKFLSPMGSVFF